MIDHISAGCAAAVPPAATAASRVRHAQPAMHLVAKHGGNRQREVEEVPGVVEGASDPERNLSGRSSEEVHGAADASPAPPLSADFGRFSADFQQMFADVRRFRVLYIIE
jgi:hypothetical protein